MATVEFMELSNMWMVPVIMLIASASVAVIVIGVRTIIRCITKAFHIIIGRKQ